MWFLSQPSEAVMKVMNDERARCEERETRRAMIELADRQGLTAQEVVERARLFYDFVQGNKP